MKKMKKMKSVISVVVVFVLVVSLCACSTTSQQNGESEEGGKDNITIGWYAPLVHDYFENIKAGVEAYEEENEGITIEYTYGSADSQTQEMETQTIESLAAKGVTNFLCYPMESEGANNLYKEITAAGCKVINYAQPGTTPTDATFYVGTDTASRTIWQAERVLEINGGSANVLVIYEALESPYMQVAKETMDQFCSEHPELNIVQECSGMSDTETAVSKITDALSANRNDIDGIVCIGYTCCVGLARVLTDYYATNPDADHITAVCNDVDAEISEAIKAGYIDEGLFEPLYTIGYISTMAMDLLAQGYESKGDYVIGLEDVIVTKDNCENYSEGVTDYTKEVSDTLLETYFK